MTKWLTVVVPSYNMEVYLRGCLDSLLVPCELLDRLDVVVVNDGSRDATSSIAHEYANRYPESFRVIDKENGNYGSCINAALPTAKGTFVKVLDADDSVDTDHFAEFLRFMESVWAEKGEAGVDLLLADFDFVDPSGRVTRHIRYADGMSSLFSLDQLPVSDVANMWTHAVAYRTELLLGMSYRQTEGISYSDNDWTFYPMSRVRTVAHFGKSVNRYLVGRAGQTVDSGTYVRHFGTVLDLIRQAARFQAVEDAERTEESRSYLDHLLASRVNHAYRMLFVWHPKDFEDSVRRSFDEDIRSIAPRLAEAADDIRASPRLSFRPVHEWRRYHRVDTIRFRLFFAYRRMVTCVQRIFSHVLNAPRS